MTKQKIAKKYGRKVSFLMNVEVIWPSQKPTYLKILGSDSPVKCGGQTTCSEFVVCGQLMLVVNPDPVINLETQAFREN